MTKELAKVKNDKHVKTMGMCWIHICAVSTSWRNYIAAPSRPWRAASDLGLQDSRWTFFSTGTSRAVSCQAASSKAACWSVMLNAAVIPAAVKKQNTRNQVLAGF